MFVNPHSPCNDLGVYDLASQSFQALTRSQNISAPPSLASRWGFFDDQKKFVTICETLGGKMCLQLKRMEASEPNKFEWGRISYPSANGYGFLNINIAP